MEIFLQGLLPRLLPGYILGKNCFVRPHNGKQDLQKKLPMVLRAYQNYPEKDVRLLIIQDQDSSDCIVLKNRLVELVQQNQPNHLKYVVRIACRELENWYLGDLAAIEQIYPDSRASKQIHKAKYRNPDNLMGAQEMSRFSNKFGKIHCARSIAPIISIEENKSPSFRHFCAGLKKLVQ